MDLSLLLSPREARTRAMELFAEGYNCSQAVLLTFAPAVGLSKDTALLLATPLGAGMGRLREVCGAVSGAFLAIGMVFGTTDPTATEEKTRCYQVVQTFSARFAEKNGSLICRELRGLSPEGTRPVDRFLHPESPVPDQRTKEYYATRPCKELVGDGAEILADLLWNHFSHSSLTN